MKALVIGGTGPTGPHVVEGLAQRGYEVSILHRGAHEIEFSAPVEHLHGDPHFVETLEETLGPRSFDVAVGMYGRLRLVAEVMRGRTPRFIGIGGIGVYRGWMRPEHAPQGTPVPTREDAPLMLDPDLHKFSYLMVMTEQAIMQFHHEGHYNATILRYPMVYGPRQLAPREWSIIRRLLDGRRQIIIPDGGLTLETKGYAENMAHAALLAVDQPQASAGQIYNVGDERALTQRDWVRTVAAAMGLEVELVDMPAILARPSRPYTGWTHHRVLDLTKVKTELGYRDVVPVEEAIRRSVQWYLEHRPEPGGEIERLLQDPFDYEAEDAFIRVYREASEKVLEVPYSRERYRHPYPHPKRPGDER